MTMFMHTGPYYDAQDDYAITPIQFQPLKARDLVTDGFSTFRVEDFVKYEGKTLVLVSCIDSSYADLIGRVGYKSMYFVFSTCWRTFTP